MGTREPKLPLGVRKLRRLMGAEDMQLVAFARTHNIGRLKLARVLRGEMKHIDIDFIGRVVRAFAPGAIDPLDFEQRTVDDEDPGEELQRKLRGRRTAA